MEDGNSEEIEDGTEDEENGTEDEEDVVEDEEETDGTDSPFFFFCIAFHCPLHLFHSFAKL